MLTRSIGFALACVGFAVGMALPRVRTFEEKVPTYYGTTKKLVDQNCVSCHRREGIGPFSLETYDDVRKFGPTIARVVKAGTMPPWFAKEPKGSPSPWQNDRSITESDKAKLYAWFNAGMPKGDSSKAPKSPTFNSSWQIGKPDAVYRLPAPIKVKADGYMEYQYAKIPVNFDQDRWIQAVEVRPGSRGVVHHILVFLVPHEGRSRAAGISSLVDYFAIYVPGQSSVIYPSGFGRMIPKGFDLRFQIHYTPNGKETKDQSEIGFRFASKPPENEVKTASVLNLTFAIPPGAPNHEVVAKRKVPVDINIVSLLPHSHLRGKAARYELIDEEGNAKTLLDIPKYDFNWQLQYDLKKPLLVKAGTTIKYTSWYDNSEKNYANPDATKTVRWGDQTYDEMALGYVLYYPAKR